MSIPAWFDRMRDRAEKIAVGEPNSSFGIAMLLDHVVIGVAVEGKKHLDR